MRSAWRIGAAVTGAVALTLLATAAANATTQPGGTVAPAGSGSAIHSQSGDPESRVIHVEGVETEMSTMGTNLTDCMYYHNQYLGCSYFDADPDPEIFTVCDEFGDGRYVKGRIKFGGNVYELSVAGVGKCVYWAPNIAEGTHLGIHTGVEGVGWTAYEYGYA